MSEETPTQDLIAGGIGGLLNVLSGHPLDTIKVRLQTMPHIYKGTWDATKKIILQEGPFGLYKGIMSPLVTVVPMCAIGFLGFGFGKEFVSKPDQKTLTATQTFLAGMFSGGSTSFIIGPMERIKCLLQVEVKEPRKYNGFLDCAIKLWKEGGIRNLCLGTCATFLRDVPSTGFFYCSYQLIARKLADQSDEVTMLQSVVAGGFAGLANWLIALPIDTIKSKLQTAPQGKYPRGFRSAFLDVVTKNGLPALFHGIAPVMIRAFPSNAAFILGVELAKKLSNEYAP